MAHGLLEYSGETYGESAVKTIEILRGSANEGNLAPAFVNGFTDGQAARSSNIPLGAYQRVGIDDYAKGFRAGFFQRAQTAPGSERPSPRNVVNL